MTLLEYVTQRIKEERTMIWAVLPWNRCKASLEPNKTPYWGRCERLKKHGGDHALERGFDVVWFKTSIVNLRQEWEAMRDYAKTDVEATTLMMESLPYGPPVRPQNICRIVYKDKDGVEWPWPKDEMSEPSVSVQTFLALICCPVCKQQLKNHAMGDGEIYCEEHGKFILKDDRIIWER